MASLLQITNASKSYGDQILLDRAEATISDNTKVGFIGRNGAGKSTLLRIERTIAQLDDQKKALNAQMMKSTNAAEAMKLHTELEAIAGPLAEAEERWVELQEELGEA